MANWKADDVIASIERNKGNLSAVARQFGVSRMTVHRYMADHPTVKAAVSDARESMLDNAESVLYKKVLEGSTPELIFFLKTQGRNRGYVERVEQTHSGSVDMIVKGYTTVTPDDWDADKTDSHL